MSKISERLRPEQVIFIGVANHSMNAILSRWAVSVMSITEANARKMAVTAF